MGMFIVAVIGLSMFLTAFIGLVFFELDHGRAKAYRAHMKNRPQVFFKKDKAFYIDYVGKSVMALFFLGMVIWSGVYITLDIIGY